MCKKLLIAVLAVVVGVGVVSSTRLGSHIRLWWSKSSTWAKEQVPLESEIERLRMEVSNLSQEDDRYYDQVARQQRQVLKLREKVTKQRDALAKQEDYIKAMRAALAREEGAYVSFNGSRYDRTRAEADVRNEAARFLADEKIVKADEDNLAILEQTLATNKTELASLGLKRKQMEADLLILERELAQQRLKDQSNLVVDHGRYGKVAKEIEEVRERFAVLKTKSDLRGETAKGSIRAEEERKAAAQKLDQAIEARFGKTETKRVADGD
jgi:phage shock protein A